MNQEGKMNQEVKALWLKALRSGEYQRTEGTLCRVVGEGERYCCLGVLTDLAAKAGVVEWTVGSTAGENRLVVKEEVGGEEFKFTHEESSALPTKVKEWAGLTEDDPGVKWGAERSHLSTVNDQGVGFEDIADMIEGQL
jgi:hypothetical protein